MSNWFFESLASNVDVMCVCVYRRARKNDKQFPWVTLSLRSSNVRTACCCSIDPGEERSAIVSPVYLHTNSSTYYKADVWITLLKNRCYFRSLQLGLGKQPIFAHTECWSLFCNEIQLSCCCQYGEMLPSSRKEVKTSGFVPRGRGEHLFPPDHLAHIVWLVFRTELLSS